MWTRPLTTTLLIAATAAAVPAQHAPADLSPAVAEAVRRCPQHTIFDDVRASVAGETVTLTGVVTSTLKRTQIETHLASVAGVRHVVNRIEVLPGSARDADLRQRAAQALYGHASFWRYAAMPSPPIHIIVRDADILLTGTVTSDLERVLAQRLARVEGALGVRNELVVKAPER